MTERADSAVRIVLIIVGLAGIAASFAIGGAADVETFTRFLALTALGWVIAMAMSGLEIVEPYASRRPLLSRWGQPGVGTPFPLEAPQPSPPPDGVAVSSARLGPAFVGVLVALIIGGVAGAIGYALSSSPTTHGGLFTFVVLGAAIRYGFRWLLRMASVRSAVRVDSEQVRLGTGVGYLPPLTFPRHAIASIQLHDDPQTIAFATGERRYEVSLDALENEDLLNQIAAVWPGQRWVRVPDSARAMRYRRM